MFRPKRERAKGLSINTMIPNILTMLALCSGLTSLHFGLQDQWQKAVIAIVVAGVFDALDGRIARLLNATSKFGAELDSLSDFVSFGVAPGLLLYLWTLREADPIGWVLVLLFCVCCGLRLARFNTDLEKPGMPVWAYNYFTGVPAPMGALLVLLPMILSFQFEADIFNHPAAAGVMLICVSGLLISRIPTYSGKKFRVPVKFVLPMLLFVGLLAAFLVSAPWATFSILLIAYAASIPFGIRSFNSLKRQAEALKEDRSGKRGAVEGSEVDEG